MTEGEQLADSTDRIDYSGLTPRDEYMDPNGHLNTGYYTVLMDRAAVLSFQHLGMGWEFARDTGISQFSLGSTLFHFREVTRDMPLGFRFHLVDVAEKLVHFHILMIHAEEGWEAASFEGLNLCMDLAARKSRAWPDEIRKRLDLLVAAHRLRPAPRGLGSRLEIRRKPLV